MTFKLIQALCIAIALIGCSSTSGRQKKSFASIQHDALAIVLYRRLAGHLLPCYPLI